MIVPTLQATSAGVAQGTGMSMRAELQCKVEVQDPASRATSQPQTDVSSQAVLQPSSRWTTIDEDEEKQQLPQVGWCDSNQP